ncbi:MAG: 16S rRNA (adenine(1518)-N(6)/adenine(1519)-N(6))-dimethyltransferase RsmA, partial [Gammaproteobacteria bacterium]|nr:16S rRNA (adenine(1518)-N(6)/adenine(1519)-N(6))-dimethyltransferase RsmA [Gammaproteobacteria bacterium]
MTHRYHARKRFGQNFLSDPAIVHQIIDAIHPEPHEHLVEIGPGLGALTVHLYQACARFTAVEIDRNLCERFRDHYLGPTVDLIEGDALKLDYRTLNPKPFRVVGNLPYNISTPLLLHLFDYLDCITSMYFMLQKEVVERITALPDSREYGRLSVITQYFCDTAYLLDIPPEAFHPAPKVDSAFFCLTPKKDRPPVDLAKFELIVRTAFHTRRKTLSNSLKSLFTREQLIQVGIDPQARAEVLSVEDY